jgi:hypothetical protein
MRNLLLNAIKLNVIPIAINQNAECHFAEFLINKFLLLNVIKMSVILPNVNNCDILLNFTIRNVILIIDIVPNGCM